MYRSDLTADERLLLGPVFLLTNKPVLVVVNIGTEQLDEADAIAKELGEDSLAVCLELEGDPDVVAAQGAERTELLADLGVPESVVPRLARAAYQLLGLAHVPDDRGQGESRVDASAPARRRPSARA